MVIQGIAQEFYLVGFYEKHESDSDCDSDNYVKLCCRSAYRQLQSEDHALQRCRRLARYVLVPLAIVIVSYSPYIYKTLRLFKMLRQRRSRDDVRWRAQQPLARLAASSLKHRLLYFNPCKATLRCGWRCIWSKSNSRTDWAGGCARKGHCCCCWVLAVQSQNIPQQVILLTCDVPMTCGQEGGKMNEYYIKGWCDMVDRKLCPLCYW